VSVPRRFESRHDRCSTICWPLTHAGAHSANAFIAASKQATGKDFGV